MNLLRKTDSWIIGGVSALSACILLRVLFFGFDGSTALLLGMVFSILFFMRINDQYGSMPAANKTLFFQGEKDLERMFFFAVFMLIYADLKPDMERILGLESAAMKPPPFYAFLMIGILIFELTGLIIRYKNSIKAIYCHEQGWIKLLHAALVFVFLLCAAATGIAA